MSASSELPRGRTPRHAHRRRACEPLRRARGCSDSTFPVLKRSQARLLGCPPDPLDLLRLKHTVQEGRDGIRGIRGRIERAKNPLHHLAGPQPKAETAAGNQARRASGQRGSRHRFALPHRALPAASTARDCGSARRGSPHAPQCPVLRKAFGARDAPCEAGAMPRPDQAADGARARQGPRSRSHRHGFRLNGEISC